MDTQTRINERKSIFAYIFLLKGGAISHCSKKHSVMSTMEDELVAASTAAQETIWLG